MNNISSPKKSPVRVIIADDQPLIRSGLGAFLMVYDEYQLVGEAQNSEEVLQLCELVEPDVLILEMELSGSTALEITEIIHQRWPTIKILLLCDFKDEQLISTLLDAGANGFITKDLCPDDLAIALDRLYSFDDSDKNKIFQSKEQPVDSGLDLLSNLGGRPSMAQELATAGKIQADILPAQAPKIKGWDISASLHPARETSGDFFDFIPLANNNWGVVIADVTDKGMGAALFMTLCSTLMRTYATQYPTLPALVVSTVNDSILGDTRGDMFVTAFFGVLEPDTGRLRYVNAGHNPPFLISGKKGKPIDSLRPTGMAIGVMENTHWGQKKVQFTPGDLLVLYTDGITEAQNARGRFFGDQRLLQMLRSRHGRPADEIQKDLLAEVHSFTSGSYLHDDIALMIIARK